MKLIMENWRKFLNENKTKPKSILDHKQILDLIKSRQQKTKTIKRTFSLSQTLMQKYAEEMYRLLAIRMKEEDIGQHDPDPSGEHTVISIKPKGEKRGAVPASKEAYSAEIRRWDGPEVKPTVPAMFSGGGYGAQYDPKYDLNIISQLISFIKKTEKGYDSKVVENFISFTDFITALRIYATAIHEVAHHIAGMEESIGEYEYCLEKHGLEDPRTAQRCSEQFAANETIRQIEAYWPKILNDFKSDNLPGDLKWKIWLDLSQQQQFLKYMSEAIEEWARREIAKEIEYREDEDQKAKRMRNFYMDQIRNFTKTRSDYNNAGKLYDKEVTGGQHISIELEDLRGQISGFVGHVSIHRKVPARVPEYFDDRGHWRNGHIVRHPGPGQSVSGIEGTLVALDRQIQGYGRKPVKCKRTNRNTNDNTWSLECPNPRSSEFAHPSFADGKPLDNYILEMQRLSKQSLVVWSKWKSAYRKLYEKIIASEKYCTGPRTRTCDPVTARRQRSQVVNLLRDTLLPLEKELQKLLKRQSDLAWKNNPEYHQQIEFQKWLPGSPLIKSKGKWISHFERARVPQIVSKPARDES